MTKLPFNVWLLMCVGALTMCASSIVVFTGGLIGSGLTTNASLATMPLALMVVGTACWVIPVTLLMQSIGRKRAFLIGSLVSVIAALLAVYAISEQSFLVFCGATFLLGGGLAFVQQYRFAAMESVTPDNMANAAAKVLLGGLIAAFIGPELALFAKDLLPSTFAGSYLILGLLYLLAFCLLFLYKPNHSKAESQKKGGRPLSLIIRQPIFWTALLSATVGYAVMSFIMTATPISMHLHDGHSLESTKWVIQSHIMAMFIPSLFSGLLIKRFGVTKVMLAGCFLFLLCIIIALLEQTLFNYWLALALLGVAWNFLFVGGTALLPQSYEDNERFKVQALNEFVVFSVQAVASLSSGWVLFMFGWETLLIVSIPLLLTVLISITLYKKSLL